MKTNTLDQRLARAALTILKPVTDTTAKPTPDAFYRAYLAAFDAWAEERKDWQ